MGRRDFAIAPSWSATCPRAVAAPGGARCAARRGRASRCARRVREGGLIGRGRASRPLQLRRSVEQRTTARQGPRRPTALAPLDITLALCLLARPRPGLRPGPPGALGRCPSAGHFLARVTRRAARAAACRSAAVALHAACRAPSTAPRAGLCLARVTRRAAAAACCDSASVARTPRATRRGLTGAQATGASSAGSAALRLAGAGARAARR